MRPVWLSLFLTIRVATPSLSCSGSAGSLLESGLTSESLLISRPAQVVRVTIVEPAPPPTTTTTTPPPVATTTTSTAPPARRRTVPNGARTCNDAFGSDILDSDCYAARYANLTGGMFSQLGEMSTMLSTGKIYVSRLEPVLRQIRVPMVNSGLGTAIQRGVSDLTTGLSSGTSAVNNAGNRANTSTNLLVSNMEGLFSQSLSSLTNATGSNLDAFNSLEQANLNALITRANQINLNSTVLQVLNALEGISTNGTGFLRNHSNNVSGLVNNISGQHPWLTNQVLAISSDYSMSRIPQLTGLTDANSTLRRQAILANTSDSISRALNISSLVIAANSTNAITASVSAISAKATGWVNAKLQNSGSQLQSINDSLASSSQQLSSSVSGLPTQFTQISAPVLDDVVAFSELASAVNLLALALPVSETSRINNWNLAAQANLSSLNQLLATASSALSSGVNSGATASADALTAKILSSLAQVGNVQNNLTNAMLQSQSAGLASVNAVIANLSASGVTFANMLQGITDLITMMNGTVIPASSPMAAFMTLPATLQSLSVNVTGATRNATTYLRNLNETINGDIQKYLSDLTDFWNNQSGSLVSDTGDAAVLKAGSQIEAAVRRWMNAQKTSTASSNNVFLNNNNAASIAETQRSNALGIVASTLSQASSQAALAMKNISDVVTLGPANYSLLWSTEKTSIDSANQASVNTLNSVSMTDYSKKLSAFESGLKATTNEVDELNESAKNLERATQTGQNDAYENVHYLVAAIAKEGASFNSSLVELNQSLEASNIAESQSGVSFALGPLSQDQSASQATRMLTERIANQVAALTTLNSTIWGLLKNIQSTNFALSSDTHAADNLVALIGVAQAIAQILNMEISTMVVGQTSAAAADASELVSLNATIDSDFSNLISLARNKLNASSGLSFVKDSENSLAVAAGTSNYSTNRSPLFSPNFLNATLSSLSSGILASAAAYSASLNVTQPKIGEVQKLRVFVDGTVVPNLKKENAKLTSVFSQIAAVANSTFADKQALLTSLSGFQADLDRAEGLSLLQAAALVSNTTSSLQEAMATMSSLGNAADLVKDTQGWEVSERLNSVSAVRSGIEGSSSTLNVLLKKAIVNATSFNAGLGNAADAAPTLAELVMRIVNNLRVFASSQTSNVQQLHAYFDSLDSTINSSLGSLQHGIQRDSDQISATNRDFLATISQWGTIGVANDIKRIEEDIQAAISNFAEETSVNYKSPTDIAGTIGAIRIAAGTAEPLASDALAQVGEVATDVDRMLAQTKT